MRWWPIAPITPTKRPGNERQQIPLPIPGPYIEPRRDPIHDEVYDQKSERESEVPKRGVIIIDM